MEQKKDFLVSYSDVDQQWAEWIAWQLEEVGFTIVVRAWDSYAGNNVMLEMHEAIQQTECTIAVLSPDYLTSTLAFPEWAEAFRRDPKSKNGTLIPIRVRPCNAGGLLGQIIYIDLVGLDKVAAKQTLLERISRQRRRPLHPPVFPPVPEPLFPVAVPLSRNIPYLHNPPEASLHQAAHGNYNAISKEGSATVNIIHIDPPQTYCRRRFLYIGLGVGIIGIGAGTIFVARDLFPNGSSSIWTLQNSGVSQEDLTRVAWSGKQFVAVGNNGTILSSPDGRTWTTQHAKFPGPFPPLLTDITWSGKQFVAVGPGAILTSPDGRTWTGQALDSVQKIYLLAIAGSETQLVAVGNNGTVLTSPDGMTWTSQTSGTSRRLNSIVWSGKQFIAVGDNGTILSSPDGYTWIRRYSASASQIFSGVAWSGKKFVVVGINAILTSSDGISWTSHGLNSLPVQLSALFTDVTWARSQFVAVGYGGLILFSPDGETWTTQASDSEVSLFGIAGSQSRFVAVGQAGTIVASP